MLKSMLRRQAIKRLEKSVSRRKKICEKTTRVNQQRHDQRYGPTITENTCLILTAAVNSGVGRRTGRQHPRRQTDCPSAAAL